MFGLLSYATSSPRLMLGLLIISSVIVAGVKVSPLLNEATAVPGAGAQVVIPRAIDSPVYAGLFDRPREVPVDSSRIVAESAISDSPVFSQPSDEPIVSEIEGVAEIEVVVPSTSSESQSQGSTSLTLHPTFSWMNMFSDGSLVNGEPVQIGDVITAFDPAGVLIGHFTVVSEGRFGLMALYQDDPSTTVDEGADPGDLISFQINGIPALVLGPHELIWTTNGALSMTNLAVTTQTGTLTR